MQSALRNVSFMNLPIEVRQDSLIVNQEKPVNRL